MLICTNFFEFLGIVGIDMPGQIGLKLCKFGTLFWKYVHINYQPANQPSRPGWYNWYTFSGELTQNFISFEEVFLKSGWLNFHCLEEIQG